jgi:alpha-ketoglutarate-dependent taurine dioxygenase
MLQINEPYPPLISEHTDVSIADDIQHLPLLIRLTSLPLQLSGPQFFLQVWTSCQVWIERQLLRYGAVLFRGFSIAQQNAFQSVIAGMRETVFPYIAGNSPRTKLAAGIYSSTEYPAEYFISLHNELSYMSHWPKRIFFCCLIEPEAGGQTPLIDSRTLLRSLPKDLVHEFKRKQIKYIRNLHGGAGIGKSWQQTFETNNRAELESHAIASEANTRWNPDGSVTLISIRNATETHPITGEEVWFNQADQFHPSTLPPAIYKSLIALYKSDDQLPQNAEFGDGTTIPSAYLQTIRDITQQLLSLVAWRQGDLLILDNMLVAHGRMAFRGPRKLLVSMSDGPCLKI